MSCKRWLNVHCVICGWHTAIFFDFEHDPIPSCLECEGAMAPDDELEALT